MCLLLAGCGSHAPRPTAAVVIREALGRQPGPPHRNRYSQLRVSLGAAYYVGTVLKTTNGRWGNEPTSYTYQWQRCNELGKACANITGETRKRYKITSADLGHTLLAVVTAHNASGEASEASAPTGAVLSPLPMGVPGNWTLKFADEFNDTSLNESVWTPGWYGKGISSEINNVCLSSALVSEPGDGYLHLKLVAQQNTCPTSSTDKSGLVTLPYTGSLVSSNPSDGVPGHVGFQYTYGYIEWRVYLPAVSPGHIANWPATWSVGHPPWPSNGENDTFEGLAGGLACFHFQEPGHTFGGAPGDCASGHYTGWHTFGSDWQPGVVTYYYDGAQVGRIAMGITSTPQYPIMNIGTGSPGGSTSVPSEILVDYVRVWQ